MPMYLYYVNTHWHKLLKGLSVPNMYQYILSTTKILSSTPEIILCGKPLYTNTIHQLAPINIYNSWWDCLAQVFCEQITTQSNLILSSPIQINVYCFSLWGYWKPKRKGDSLLNSLLITVRFITATHWPRRYYKVWDILVMEDLTNMKHENNQ